jgi:hypothetical protein
MADRSNTSSDNLHAVHLRKYRNSFLSKMLHQRGAFQIWEVARRRTRILPVFDCNDEADDNVVLFPTGLNSTEHRQDNGDTPLLNSIAT